jgi:hypothetical protein
MALIFEDFVDSAKGKKVAIPKKTSETLKAYKDGIEARLGKSTDINMLPGGGVLKKWSSSVQYNNKGAGKKNNGKKETPPSATPNDANVFLTRMNKSLAKYGTKSPKNTVYASEAGKMMADTAKGIVKKGRLEGMKVQPVKPPKPTANSDVKPTITKTKEISVPNGKISYTVTAENKKSKKIYVSENTLQSLWEKIRKEQ